MSITPKLLGDFTALGKTIQHNGADYRPEVAVSMAAAHVKDITDSGKMPSRVIMVVEGAKFELNGYINAQEPVLAILRKAQEENEAVVVRLEKKRKRKVDPTLPIADITATMDIARENIAKIVCGVYDFNNDTWILTREAESNPEEDPAGTIEGVKSCNVDVNGFFNKAQPAVQGGQVSNAYKEPEAKENALMSMYFFVEEQLAKNEVTIDNEVKKQIAISLLKAANFLQSKMFGLEAPVYSAYSHTRARFLVFKWIENMSPLDANATANLSSWGANLVQNSNDLWEWARATSETFG